MYILDRIEFILRESFTALFRNKWMSISSIVTCMLTLFLLGGWGTSYYYLKRYSASLPSKFEMRVFLSDKLEESKIEDTIKSVKDIPGVADVWRLDRNTVWERQKQLMPELTEDIENPLPETLKLTLSDLSTTKQIVQRIQELPYVEKNGVSTFLEEQEFIAQTMSTINKLAGGLVSLMIVCSGLLIYNTIRMTIISRRKEFKIMHLIGASRETIIIPLLVEGLLQGVVGGIIASVFLFFSYYSMIELFQSIFNSWHMDRAEHMIAGLSITGMGGLFGFTCSFIAVNESKKRLSVTGKN